MCGVLGFGVFHDAFQMLTGILIPVFRQLGQTQNGHGAGLFDVLIRIQELLLHGFAVGDIADDPAEADGDPSGVVDPGGGNFQEAG